MHSYAYTFGSDHNTTEAVFFYKMLCMCFCLRHVSSSIECLTFAHLNTPTTKCYTTVEKTIITTKRISDQVCHFKLQTPIHSHSHMEATTAKCT